MNHKMHSGHLNNMTYETKCITLTEDDIDMKEENTQSNNGYYIIFNISRYLYMINL